MIFPLQASNFIITINHHYYGLRLCVHDTLRSKTSALRDFRCCKNMRKKVVKNASLHTCRHIIHTIQVDRRVNNRKHIQTNESTLHTFIQICSRKYIRELRASLTAVRVIRRTGGKHIVFLG